MVKQWGNYGNKPSVTSFLLYITSCSRFKSNIFIVTEAISVLAIYNTFVYIKLLKPVVGSGIEKTDNLSGFFW